MFPHVEIVIYILKKPITCDISFFSHVKILVVNVQTHIKYVVTDRAFGQMVQQQSPEAKYRQNQRFYS